MLIDASATGAKATDARPVAVIARPLGVQTNNYAEYMAVLLALERAQDLGAEEVELVLDSKLVVEQLSGRWKVRHAGLAPLHGRVLELLGRLRRWSARHEPRSANHAADALANLALDDPPAARAAEAGTAAAPARATRETAPDADEQRVGRVALGAACAVFDDRGRVLLVRHSYGVRNWELPGGGSLPGESPDTAARRELEEETGLVAEPAGLAGVYYEPDEERIGPTVHFVFRFPPPTRAPVARPPEIDEVDFWPLADLPRPMSDFTAQRIHDARLTGMTFGVVGRRRWL